jgi:hypothetical protein
MICLGGNCKKFCTHHLSNAIFHKSGVPFAVMRAAMRRLAIGWVRMPGHITHGTDLALSCHGDGSFSDRVSMPSPE